MKPRANDPSTRGGRAPRIHFGYFVILAMVLGNFLPISMGLSCAGIFYPPLSEALGVDKGVLGYYSTVLWTSALVVLPFTGKLMNGGSARTCLTLGSCLTTAAFLLLWNLHYLWQFYVAAALVGASVTIFVFLAPSTLANRWFAKRAGFWLGVIMAFTGIGGVVWSTVGGMLIEQIGWSSTYLVFAVLSACTIPTSFLLTASYPADKGLQPWGAEEAEPEAGESPGTTAATAPNAGQSPAAATSGPVKHAAPDGVSAAQALRMPAFALICLICFGINMGMQTYFLMPSYASTLQVVALVPLLGSFASSATMAGQTVGKLALGAVGGRWPFKSFMAALAMGMIAVVGLGLFAESAAVFVGSALLFGAFYALTNVMMPLYTRRFFGDRDYATIYSRVSMVASISNAAGAFIWGTLVSVTGNFLFMYVGAFAIMVGTALCVVLLYREGRKKGSFKGPHQGDEVTEVLTR
ncbi:MAG: MFS transporter [Coriobacteriia bacterium]|nr:MFS transporter [Coriobacteriia bacterium]